MQRPITEQIILVTGATDSIGKGTARELARLGGRGPVTRSRCGAARSGAARNRGRDRQ
jgi:NAD(P)-dependent dehydrogenase (short-subunit alcohol dehydrogenase family)